MLTVGNRVGNDGLQACHFGCAPSRITLLHAHAVSVGLRQDFVLCNRAALPVVQVQQLVRCTLVQDGDQFF